MTEEQDELMREIVKSAATIFADMGIEYPLSYAFRRSEIPTLAPSERIRVVLIREHDEPPQHPLPAAETFAGVTGYVVEGVPV